MKAPKITLPAQGSPQEALKSIADQLEAMSPEQREQYRELLEPLFRPTRWEN